MNTYHIYIETQKTYAIYKIYAVFFVRNVIAM